MIGLSSLAWVARYEEFRDLYGFARECQADCLVDEILEIARDSSRDYVKKVGVDGKVTWVVDREHIARCGLRISALKWTVARMAPRKYGNPQTCHRRVRPSAIQLASAARQTYRFAGGPSGTTAPALYWPPQPSERQGMSERRFALVDFTHMKRAGLSPAL